jgi:hypothetical protein
MPLHDWTDERGWDSVRPLWLTYLVECVKPRLPSGYRVFIGDVPALSPGPSDVKPDVTVWGWQSRPDGSPDDGSIIPPDSETVTRFTVDPQRAVFVERAGQLIAVVEITSTQNEDRPDAQERSVQRYLGHLRRGVHLMLLDLLPCPTGFSLFDALAAGLELAMPATPAPFAAAFRVGEPVPHRKDMGTLVAVWRRPLQTGQSLPPLPLPLNVHEAVMVDLEVTYRRAAEATYLD